ncbi:MAG: hypothetical protein CL920_21890 [Deltaproteobacteria bacterium]|nr:hypothetical protein [Deltaproteobacteria bacterium]MBU51350.1 hypothetical protein [Deltaproteobacteria bacterium]
MGHILPNSKKGLQRMTEETPQRPRKRRFIISEEAMSDDIRLSMQKLRDFRQLIFSITPWVWMTPTLIALNVLIFIVMIVSGTHILQPSAGDLLRWGANHGPSTFQQEPWRLFTSMFIHVGVIHLAINMYALWAIGRFVERLVGNFGFLVLYLVSGLLGSLISVSWKIDVLSAGASGAIFGVFGALMGFAFLRRDTIPPEILQNLKNNGIFFVGINLFLGFSFPMIDMAAHIGGLIAGVFCGVVLSQPLTPDIVHKRWTRNLILGLLGSSILIIGYKIAPKKGVKSYAFMRQVEITDQEMSKVMGKAERAISTQPLEFLKDTRTYVKMLKQKVLPRWQKLEKMAKQLPASDPPERLRFRIKAFKKYVGLRRQYISLLTIMYGRATPKPQMDTLMRQKARLNKQINEIVQQLNDNLHQEMNKQKRSQSPEEFVDWLKKEKKDKLGKQKEGKTTSPTKAPQQPATSRPTSAPTTRP